MKLGLVAWPCYPISTHFLLTSILFAPSQIACVHRCADKYINTNQKIMQVFMEVQPQVVAKRLEKMEQQAAETQGRAEEPGHPAAAPAE